MIKEINVPYGKSFVYDGGTLVKGDTKAYYLTVKMPLTAENAYTALAVNQSNGNYSDESNVSADGHTVSVRLINSMYNSEGLAVIRLVIMDGDKTVTVKEVRFDVQPENNTETIAEDEPNILNTLIDVKTRLEGFKFEFITSPDAATREGIYAVESGDGKRNILLVSYADDEATTTEKVYQFMVDASSGSAEQRSGHSSSGNIEWGEWENIGDVDLSEYVKTSALQSYYTKSEVDTKTSNTFKYKGTFISPMVIPKSGFNSGDVYNCAWGNYVPQMWLDNKEITSITESSITGGNTKFTVTFAEDYGIAFNYVQYVGIQLEGNPNGAIIGYLEGDPTHTGNVLEIIMDTNKYSDYTGKGVWDSPYYALLSFMSGHTGNYTTSVLNIWWGETYGQAQYVYDGGDVVYTGNSWDSLGSNFDPSNYYTKSQTNSQIDTKISAAITTTLNTEV